MSGIKKLKRTLPLIDSINILPNRSSLLTLVDVNKVIEQLGFIPYNIIDIGAKNENEDPLVVVCYPLNKNDNKKGNYFQLKPFPTTIWMSNPDLKSEISKLEVVGWVTKLQERLRSKEEYLDQMKYAHEKYAEERWSYLTPADIELIETTPGWFDSLRFVGVAGIRDHKHVKCLHCHYAHYLARPLHKNIIGEWVHELLQELRNDPILFKIKSENNTVDKLISEEEDEYNNQEENEENENNESKLDIEEEKN